MVDSLLDKARRVVVQHYQEIEKGSYDVNKELMSGSSLPTPDLDVNTHAAGGGPVKDDADILPGSAEWQSSRGDPDVEARSAQETPVDGTDEHAQSSGHQILTFMQRLKPVVQPVIDAVRTQMAGHEDAET